jgi:major vault protein
VSSFDKNFFLSAMSDPNVFRIKPYQYIHILNNNTLVTSLLCGPVTFTRKEHEKVVFGPEQMINIPPRNYVQILNPVVRDASRNPVLDADGNYQLRHGYQEIRFSSEKEPLPGVAKEAIFDEPFPLYPGEKVVKRNPLVVVKPDEALLLRAIQDVTIGERTFSAGEEWLFEGPGTYIPRVEVLEAGSVKSYTIRENYALRVRAKRNCVDSKNAKRVAGEEWLVSTVGSYLPSVNEEIVDNVRAQVLTDTKAIRLRANREFVDQYGQTRKAGQEWIVTSEIAETHLPDVAEEFIGEIALTSLNNRQYCVVLDPVGKDGKNQLGRRELRKGECSFFLNPGERLEGGVQNVYVLSEEEALLLTALETFMDGETVRTPGDRWMISGPCDYIPTTQIQVLETRKVIPLDENEGIYIRDLRTGRVRTVMGVSTMLTPYEVLWEKELPTEVEELLQLQGDSRNSSVSTTRRGRDRTRVVSYRAPHNSAVQIYDYKAKKARIVLGPDLVLLGADEEFTVLNLSGGNPKKEAATKSLCLMLGPDFMTDTVTVETSDHARLMLKLSYNWFFDVARGNPEDISKIFAVPDFVGDACKAIASRVRGAVASSSFDAFHRGSSDIIRKAVFGLDKSSGELRKYLRFSSNGLVVSEIDVQSVEPIEQKTRDALQLSVQLAIEITTKSQEATARHESQCEAQIASGRLQIQMIEDEARAEKEKQELLRLRAHTENIQAAGEATAEARAKADAAEIQAKASVERARHSAEAKKIKATAELQQLRKKNANELAEVLSTNELEINRARRMASIEAKKFKDIVDAIGADTIKSIAQAGPEMQAKLLQGLGLKSFMITDGNSPINLFNTASGLVGGAQAQM